jgi:hypothetical protein
MKPLDYIHNTLIGLLLVLVKEVSKNPDAYVSFHHPPSRVCDLVGLSYAWTLEFWEDLKVIPYQTNLEILQIQWLLRLSATMMVCDYMIHMTFAYSIPEYQYYF